MLTKTPLQNLYETLGEIELSGATGGQLQGNCLFCGKSNHFYVNPENGGWDCKVCQDDDGEPRKGYVEQFLEQLHELRLEETTNRGYDNLSKQRGIPADTLRRNLLVKAGDDWLFPTYDVKGKLNDLRRWNSRTGEMRGSAGQELVLFGGEKLAKRKKPSVVFVCEGEWDKLAMESTVRKVAEFKNAIVVGVPGAAIFKNEWVGSFKGHNVYVLFDNDSTGSNLTAAAGCLYMRYFQ
ncbi:toprim domain-containing protein [Poriferisphaera sp. WC338]|uniref:toprim domain-containing protein n=1 Tax=Poriferisphaera sp. WC338 TaxID=3425129 RepID=UPI003D816974